MNLLQAAVFGVGAGSKNVIVFNISTPWRKKKDPLYTLLCLDDVKVNEYNCKGGGCGATLFSLFSEGFQGKKTFF